MISDIRCTLPSDLNVEHSTDRKQLLKCSLSADLRYKVIQQKGQSHRDTLIQWILFSGLVYAVNCSINICERGQQVIRTAGELRWSLQFVLRKIRTFPVCMYVTNACVVFSSCNIKDVDV